jgi:cytochrome c oxidase assembly protein subunit 17
MGNSTSKTTTSGEICTPESKEKCKPCCACPETRKARDECVMKFGDEAEEKCRYLIKAHQDCMRDMGFNI